MLWPPHSILLCVAKCHPGKEKQALVNEPKREEFIEPDIHFKD